MNFDPIRKRAMEWMIERGWKQKWGKRGTFTQSLFQHTDIELNALGVLLPILADTSHYGLTEHEQQVLVVGVIAHDVGKETAEWQAYIRLPETEQRGKFVPHILPKLTETVVPELAAWLGFDAAVIADAVACVNLHMAAARSVPALLGTLTNQAQQPGSGRWNSLARIVEAVDKFCSIDGLLPTRDYLAQGRDNGVLSPHVRLGYHLTTLRGVSTVLLHKAADEVYRAAGWQPILYFSNGTVYVTDGRATFSEPSPAAIIEQLGEVIEEAMPTRFFPKMVVGSPTSRLIPKPEFFDYRELAAYLREAAQRVKRGSFLRKPAAIRFNKLQGDNGYWNLSGKPAAEQNLETDSERIDRAQPLMMIFKFFRDALKPDLVGRAGGLVHPDDVAGLMQERDNYISLGGDPDRAQKRYEKAVQKLEKAATEAWIARVTEGYDAVFGAGAYARLRSTSTLMPVPEMITVIDPLWALPGTTLGLTTPMLEAALDDQLETALIAQLDALAQTFYVTLPEAQRPTRTSAIEIAMCFASDLIHPIQQQDIVTLTATQCQAYALSKPEAMRDRAAPRLCPVCNAYFERGTAAVVDFVNNPEAHTNRAVAHGYTGKVVICDACKYERFLQQLLLGEKVARVLVLTPRMHVGFWTGQTFRDTAVRFYEQARDLMSNSTHNPNENITLTLTQLIAGKLLREDEAGSPLQRAIRQGLEGETLARLLTYTTSPDKQKSRWNELAKALREAYELEKDHEDLELLNQEWETNYTTWEAVLQGIFAGEVRNETVEAIRAQIYRLYPQFRMVCQTPNFILVPLTSSFKVGDKESDANAALRELFILLLVGLALDCSVATVDAGEPLWFHGGEGVAQVPAVPAVRDLVGGDWVGLTAAPVWLEKIGAASLLQRDWDGRDKQPGRSTLYQILTSTTPGHILRRIEMQNERGAASDHIDLILKSLQEVPNA